MRERKEGDRRERRRKRRDRNEEMIEGKDRIADIENEMLEGKGIKQKSKRGEGVIGGMKVESQEEKKR